MGIDTSRLNQELRHSGTLAPRGPVHVLLAFDEDIYEAGESTMGDHPIAWYHEFDGGRSFYTALGHTEESYAEGAFLSHLAGAIEWAVGSEP